MEVPATAKYGIHTMRAIHNFTEVPSDVDGRTDWTGISDRTLGSYPSLVRAYAAVKKACALSNRRTSRPELSDDVATAIDKACDDLIAGDYDTADFPVDMLQGGAGTSTNMNVNEVIANTAILKYNEIYGTEFSYGDYEVVHPIQDVNRSQSTNDTYPTAAKIAVMERLSLLQNDVSVLVTELRRRADQHENDVKLGRTQLQDAVPMTYAQELRAWASQILEANQSVHDAKKSLETVPLGGTAIGTELNAGKTYTELAVKTLSDIVRLPLKSPTCKISYISSVNSWLSASSSLRQLATTIAKMANDLRLLSSGPNAGIGEYSMPRLQAGSSIMPGKVNPVGMEAVNQVCFKIIGMDTTITAACNGAQLQLFAFEPLVVKELLDGIAVLRAGIRIAVNSVKSMDINVETGRMHAEESYSNAAALNEEIGYEAATQYVKTAVEHGLSLRDEILRHPHENDDPQRLVDLLDPLALTKKEDR